MHEPMRYASRTTSNGNGLKKFQKVTGNTPISILEPEIKSEDNEHASHLHSTFKALPPSPQCTAAFKRKHSQNSRQIKNNQPTPSAQKYPQPKISNIAASAQT
jgi:hypothetical protein